MHVYTYTHTIHTHTHTHTHTPHTTHTHTHTHTRMPLLHTYVHKLWAQWGCFVDSFSPRLHRSTKAPNYPSYQSHWVTVQPTDINGWTIEPLVMHSIKSFRSIVCGHIPAWCHWRSLCLCMTHLVQQSTKNASSVVVAVSCSCLSWMDKPVLYCNVYFKVSR